MDQQHRELERRFKETGSVEDEARLLRARVRSGALSSTMLVIAAYLGSDGATAAAEGLDEIERLREDLFMAKAPAYPLGLMLETMADLDGHAGIRAAIAATRYRDGGSPFVEATEEWVVCPCSRHLAALVHLGGDPLCFAAQVVSEGLPAGDHLARIPRDGSVHEQLEACETICSEVVPWALGVGDPVRDRVEARRESADE